MKSGELANFGYEAEFEGEKLKQLLALDDGALLDRFWSSVFYM